MPIAHNPDTGETVFLDSDNQWKPAKQAFNPKTREMMAYDGKDWVHVDNAIAKNVGQQMSGTAPVKSTLQSAAENLLPSAANMAKGVAGTVVGAGEALINPDPRAKIGFIKDLAVGTYEGLKQRYGSGLEHAIATDPVGVIGDVLSVGFGLRGGLRSGVAGGVRSGETEAAATGGVTRGLEPPKPTVPTTEQLFDNAAPLYKKAESAGITIKPDAFVGMVSDVASELKTAGFDKDIQKSSAAALRRLFAEARVRMPSKNPMEALTGVKSPEAAPITLSEFDTVRKIVNSATQSIEKDDRRIAGTIRGAMDDFLSNLTEEQVVGGNKEGIAALIQARQLWARASKSAEIDRLFEHADLDAPNYNAAGYENALKNQFKKLAKNDKRMRKFSPEEQDAIRAVAKGNKVQSAFTKLGKFSPTAGFFGGVLTGKITLAALSGHPELLMVPAIGAISKRLATMQRSGTAEGARALVAGGKEVSDYMKRRREGKNRALSSIGQGLPLTELRDQQ